MSPLKCRHFSALIKNSSNFNRLSGFIHHIEHVIILKRKEPYFVLQRIKRWIESVPVRHFLQALHGAVDFIQQSHCGFRRAEFLCNVQNGFFQFLPRSRQIDDFIHAPDSPLSVFDAGLPSCPHEGTVPVLFPLRFPLPAV